MLERFEENVQIRVGSVDNSEAEVLQLQARQFNKAANYAHDRLDKEAAGEAAKQGTIDGANDMFADKRDGYTISDQAYNKALAISTAAARENDMKAKLDTFQQAYEYDVEGFNEAVKGYRTGMESALEPEERATFGLVLDRAAQARVSKIGANVRKQQMDEGRANIDLAMQNTADEMARLARAGDVDGASMALDTLVIGLEQGIEAGLITPAEAVTIRDNASRQIDRELVLGNFEDTLDNLGLEAAHQQLSAFADARPEGLSPDEHRKRVQEMQTLWNREATRQNKLATLRNARQTAVEKANKADVKDAVFLLENGKQPDNLVELMGRVAGTDLGQELYEASQVAGYVQALSSEPPEVRQQVLNDWRQKDDITAQQLRTLQAMEKRDAELTRLAEDNAMDYGAEAGLVDGLSPLQADDPIAPLQERKQAALAVGENLGRTVSPLNSADEMAITRVMDQSDMAGKLSTLGVLVEGLGRDHAIVALDDMADLDGGYAQAGVALAEGDAMAAELILAGREIRQNKELSSLMPSDKDLMIEMEDLREVYGDSPERFNQIVTAVKDAYAAHAYRNGLLDGQIDTNLVESAIINVTGGIIDSDWGMVTAPFRGARENDLDNWIDSLDADDMAGIAVRSPGGALKRLQDEDVALEDLGHGRYLVRDGAFYWTRDDGNPFVLEYSR